MKLTARVALTLLGIVVVVGAQTPKGLTPKGQLTMLERIDLSAAGREAIAAVYDLEPASASGWLTHPGEMVAYVTAGSVVIEQRGMDRRVQAGQSFIIPAGVAHNVRNVDGASARMFVTFIVEKSKALSAPTVAP